MENIKITKGKHFDRECGPSSVPVTLISYFYKKGKFSWKEQHRNFGEESNRSGSLDND